MENVLSAEHWLFYLIIARETDNLKRAVKDKDGIQVRQLKS